MFSAVWRNLPGLAGAQDSDKEMKATAGMK